MAGGYSAAFTFSSAATSTETLAPTIAGWLERILRPSQSSQSGRRLASEAHCPTALATRYTGDVTNEPPLVLTDDTALIQSTNAYMGRLSTLLQRHVADPVDGDEQLRNDLVYYPCQTNRKPFVDHPEWVNLTFTPHESAGLEHRVYSRRCGVVLAGHKPRLPS